MARLLTKDISAIYYLDPDTHVQDPTYGGLTKLTPEELLGAMVTCSEKIMLGEKVSQEMDRGDLNFKK